MPNGAQVILTVQNITFAVDYSNAKKLTNVQMVAAKADLIVNMVIV